MEMAFIYYSYKSLLNHMSLFWFNIINNEISKKSTYFNDAVTGVVIQLVQLILTTIITIKCKNNYNNSLKLKGLRLKVTETRNDISKHY